MKVGMPSNKLGKKCLLEADLTYRMLNLSSSIPKGDDKLLNPTTNANCSFTLLRRAE